MTNNQTIIFIMTQQTNFSVGNLVQIIDPAEHPSEWATFVISYRFLFLYRLSRVNSSIHGSFWVKSNEIASI